MTICQSVSVSLTLSLSDSVTRYDAIVGSTFAVYKAMCCRDDGVSIDDRSAAFEPAIPQVQVQVQVEGNLMRICA